MSADGANDQLVPTLELQDVLGPIATLLGLLGTALGVLTAVKASVGLDATTFQFLTVVIVAIMLVFVLCAILALAAAYTRKTSLWNLSKITYVGSWFVFAAGFVVILIEISYGPVTISLPSLPNTNALSLLIQLVAVAVPIASFAWYSFRRLPKELERDIRRALDGLSEPAKAEAAVEMKSKDVKSDFADRIMTAEDLVRRVALSRGIDVPDRSSALELMTRLRAANVIEDRDYQLFKYVWQVRNRTIHGYDLPTGQVKESLGLLIGILDRLSALLPKRSPKANVDPE